MQARKNRLVFNSPSQEESLLIKNKFVELISDKGIDVIFANRTVILGRGQRSEAFLLSTVLENMLSGILTHRHPYFIGLYLGTLKSKKFVLSLQVLPLLTPFLKEDRRVIVTVEGEQRFLYGHHLNPEDIAHTPPSSNQPIDVVVVNERGQALGYAKLQLATQPVLINQQDLGWYLRRGR